MNIYQEIKDKISLSNLIGRYVSLEHRSGDEYKGLCPFHNEKTPSFSVNDMKGVYYCFGCKASGDIFSFLSEYNKLSRQQALELLAKQAGISLKEDNVGKNKNSIYYDIYSYACNIYHKNLFNNKTALEYLKCREIKEEVIKKYGIGYVMPIDQMLTLLKKQFSEDELISSKLIFKNDSGTFYSLFTDRIVFPIKDSKARVVAFGGRILGDKGVKYLNSSSSPIFSKKEYLYGMHNVSRKQIILVEGYFDVIALREKGFCAVAPLGTGLSEEQLKLLWRYTNEPIICFDGDEAGRKAMFRIARMALKHITHKQTLQFIVLEEGVDPDLQVKKDVKSMETVVNNKIGLARFIFDILSESKELNTPEKKAALKVELMDLADEIKDRDLKYYYKSEFREYLKEFFNAKRYNKNDILVKSIVKYDKKMLNICLALLYNTKLLDDDGLLEELSMLEVSGLDAKMLDLVLSLNTNNVTINEVLKQVEEIIGDSLSKLYLLPFVRSDDINQVKGGVLSIIKFYQLNMLKKQMKFCIDEISVEGLSDERMERLQSLKKDDVELRKKLGII